MVGRVKVTVDELSSTSVKVGDRVLTPTQSGMFDLDKPLSIEVAEQPEVPPAPTGEPDVFDHQNPNGISYAEIAPKLTKASGELRTVVGKNGRLLDVTIEGDPNLVVAQGGPDGAETGETPGPKPDPQTFGTNPTANATGVSDPQTGAPLPQSRATLEATSKGKAPAKGARDNKPRGRAKSNTQSTTRKSGKSRR